jgi:hypothetical protein
MILCWQTYKKAEQCDIKCVFWDKRAACNVLEVWVVVHCVTIEETAQTFSIQEVTTVVSVAVYTELQNPVKASQIYHIV